MIFDGIYDEKKYRYPAFSGRYAFAFNQVVDEKPYKSTQSYDITLKILTPDSDERADETVYRIMSNQGNCVLVVLPDDRAFLDEIRSAMQIEKFLVFDSANNSAKYNQVKDSLRTEHIERRATAKLFLTESLKNAEIYANGDKVQTQSKEISSRINESIGKLIGTVYHKLNYITAAMNDNDIRELFKDNGKQLTLANTSSTPNELALNDVNSYIATNTSRHLKTSMKSVLERFLKAPYGFVEADIWWLVAKLFKDGDIAFFVNNEAITLLSHSAEEIIRFITRKEFNERLMFEKRIKANEKQKKSVREVAKELLGATLSSDDDDAIMKSFLTYASNLKVELEKLEIRYQTEKAYPGKNLVATGKRLMTEISQLKYASEFFNTIDNKKDDYLDFAEDYEPLKKFFAGEQKDIFDKALRLMKIYDESKTFIVDEELEAVVDSIKQILKKAAPYSEIFKLPELLEKFSSLYVSILNDLEAPVQQAIDDAKTRVFDELKGKKCHDKLSDKFITLFKEIRDKAEHCNNVAQLQNIKVEADALKVRCLNEISAEEVKMTPVVDVPPAPVDDNTEDVPEVVVPIIKQKKNKTVSIKSINTSTTWQIETADDVKKYITELERKLLNSLEEDTIINIEF